jgi:ribonuclease H2 subunit A
MLSTTPTNLNEMSHDAARMLVQAVLDAGLTVSTLYVDTVGPEAKYQDKLEQFFPTIKIHVSKKADAKYKVVGAASINAKVTRDQMLENFEFEEPGLETSREFGSGYTSDPHTINWAENEFDPVFGLPSIARFGWSSVANLFSKHKATADFETVPDAPIDSSFYAGRHLANILL